MKKVIAWLLVLALTAVISIGATLAYLTDTDEDVNVMTLGNVKIDQLEYERIDDETANDDAEVQEFHDNKPLLPAVTDKDFDYTPGDTVVDWEQIGKDGYTSDIWNPDQINNELDKMVFVKNEGTYDAYVRTVFAFEAGNYETLDEFQAMMHLNLNNTDWFWEWSEEPVEIPNAEGSTTKYFIATATYNKILEPGKLTEISLSQVALDKTATNADVEAFGETYQILVKTQAIQADGFIDAATALNEGFGIVSEEIPWEIDSVVQGAELMQALHYLNADPAGEAITSKVSSITFGTNKEYADIINAYEGVYVGVEQDVPAYAYYVPNGDNYDIYVLSKGTIYAPANSGKLFNGMSALTALDTDNLSFSRTTSMRAMLQKCTALTSVDASGWDTSKVEDMTGIFNNCSGLKSVEGTENWNLASCTQLYATFQGCAALTSLDLTGWNTSKVTNMQSLFNGCNNLTEFTGIENWDLRSLQNMRAMFQNCNSMVELDVSDWNIGNVTDLAFTFSGCKKLKALDTTDWNTSSVTTFQQTFCYCHVLEDLDVSGWDTSAAQSLYGTFYECYVVKELDVSEWNTENVNTTVFTFCRCKAVTELDVSDWDMSKVTDAGSMFSSCHKVQKLDVADWDLSNCTGMRLMFNECKVLTELDVSKWNTGKVTTMEGMFNHCEILPYLNVSNWDTSKVTNLGTCFQQCWGLQELDVSKWDTSACTYMGWTFYGCNKLKVIDVSNWKTGKVTVMSHMFADCNSVKVLEVNNWDLSSLQSLDATFNDCDSLITIDVSNWNTSNVREFSQIFDGSDNLQYIYGMENWNTTNGRNFDEIFNRCTNLRELNFSGWDTRNLAPGHKNVNGDISKGFDGAFDGPVKLEKLIIGENFSFDGNGTVKPEYQAKLPAPAAKEGYTALWRNVETGEVYEASQIPEQTAATYEAYYVANTTT